MDKLDVVKKIQEIGVVAVVRGKTPEEAIMMSEACIKGGVTIRLSDNIQQFFLSKPLPVSKLLPTLPK